MSSPYRALLARPGARPLAAASAVAWLSYSIYGLGLVLVIERGTGSFAPAGATLAAFSAGSATLAPLRGRLVDRGGGAALRALALIHASVMLALVGLAVAGAPTGALALAGGLAGATVPPLIAVARSSWAEVAGPHLAPAAHALNAAAGELAQVVGPLAIAGLVLVAPPALPVVLLLGGLLVAARVLSRGHAAGPAAAGAATSARARGRWGWPGGRGLAVLLAGEALLGVAFGALDLALPAAAAARGDAPAAAALPLGVLAAASAVAALLAGSGARRPPAAARFAGGLMVAAAGLALVALAAPGLPQLLACAPAGAGLGLAFAAVLELLDEVVDPARATEAFTWLTTAAGLGAALGAGLAGLLGDRPDAALAVAPAAAGLAAVAAVAGLAVLTTSPTHESPAT